MHLFTPWHSNVVSSPSLTFLASEVDTAMTKTIVNAKNFMTNGGFIPIFLRTIGFTSYARNSRKKQYLIFEEMINIF